MLAHDQFDNEDSLDRVQRLLAIEETLIDEIGADASLSPEERGLSRMPLASARGSELLILSRDREGAVVKTYAGHHTSPVTACKVSLTDRGEATTSSRLHRVVDDARTRAVTPLSPALWRPETLSGAPARVIGKRGIAQSETNPAASKSVRLKWG